ncbi:MAG: hypothetical protein, partial [Olavius algarvensis Gamma 1 endosymbiont]
CVSSHTKPRRTLLRIHCESTRNHLFSSASNPLHPPAPLHGSVCDSTNPPKRGG